MSKRCCRAEGDDWRSWMNGSRSPKWVNSWFCTSHRLHQRVLLHDLMSMLVRSLQAIRAAGLLANRLIHHWLKSVRMGVWKRLPTLSREWEEQMMSMSSGYMISFTERSAAPFTAAPSRIAATSLLSCVAAGRTSPTSIIMSSRASCWPDMLLERTWNRTSRCWMHQSLSTYRSRIASASPWWVLPSKMTAQ